MTILPKKKATQGKSEGESQESVQHHGAAHLQNIASQDSLNREIIYPSRTSPSRWHSGSSREGSSTEYDDYFEGLESSGGPCHSSSKRLRHRASPHRNLSRKGHAHGHHHRNNASSPQTSGLLATSVGGHGINDPGDDPPTTEQDEAGASVSIEEIEDHSGYNSGDEYGARSALYEWSPEEWEEREKHFEKKMRKKSFIIKKMCEDGACLFRAVADQVYGDQEMHSAVRNHCMDYMLKNSDYYSQYVTEDFNQYVERKRKDNIHGNHIEIQALSEIYNRPIEIYHYSNDPINTFHGMTGTDNEPIRLSYHKSTHYNSIVNPYKATIGVGLGLPAFKPGLAEKNLMLDAKKISEQFQLEQAMLEDKLKATDWEATNEAIEEQVARESYLQWLKDNEKRAVKGNQSSTATSSASSSAMDCSGACGTTGRTSPRTRTSPRNSPKAECSQQSTHDTRSSPVASVSGCGTISDAPKGCASEYDFPLLETASFMNQHPPSVFGLSEWDDADILAQVLAVSQQEYLDRLKQESSSNAVNKDVNCS